jgi:hypothetical protein
VEDFHFSATFLYECWKLIFQAKVSERMGGEYARVAPYFPGGYVLYQMAEKWQLDGWKPSQFPTI